MLFKGDTLFLGAVGRSDEANRAEGEQRTHLLYRSLQHVLALRADTIILPGHTSSPVAFDGRPLLGILQAIGAAIPHLEISEDAFVADVLNLIPPTPPNHQ
jgi:glyoxylase-like metal-dependent hydrolase (beta-lactamase superfamily II)